MAYAFCINSTSPISPQLLKAKELGATAVRIDAPMWGSYQLQVSMIKTIEASGLDPLWILSYGNPESGNDKKGVVTPAERAAYVSVASTFVRRTTKGKFEIWNEPNLPAFWNSPNPKDYALLCNDTVKALREIRSNVEIYAGALANVSVIGSGGDKAEAYLKTFLQEGGMLGVNALSIHTYCAPVNLRVGIKRAMDRVRRSGWSGNVVVTEVGYKHTEAPATVALGRSEDALGISTLMDEPVRVWGPTGPPTRLKTAGLRGKDAIRITPRVKDWTYLYVKDGWVPGETYMVEAEMRSVSGLQEVRLGIEEQYKEDIVGESWTTVRAILTDVEPKNADARRRFILSFCEAVDVNDIRVYHIENPVGNRIDGREVERLGSTKLVSELGLSGTIYWYTLVDGHGEGYGLLDLLVNNRTVSSLTVYN